MATQICKICNKILLQSKHKLSYHLKIHNISQKEYYDKYIKTKNEGICLVCQKDTRFFNIKRGYQTHCCISCAQQNPQTRNKMEQSVLKKYGTKIITQSDSFKEKSKKTWLKKYGVDNPSKSKKILRKKEQTFIKHYGVKNNMLTEEFMDSRIKAWKYGTAYNHKKYILPSGTIIYKQGYEPQFLDYIFNNMLLKENEIVYFPKRIKFVDTFHKYRYYFPDFYIPKFNLIIEIKSTWTIKLDKFLYLKEIATKNNGFNYIKIIDNKFKEFYNTFLA